MHGMGDSLHFFTDTFPPKTYNQFHQNVNFIREQVRTTLDFSTFSYIFPTPIIFKINRKMPSTPYVYNIFTSFTIKSIIANQILQSFTPVYQPKLYKNLWQNRHFHHLIPSFQHSFFFIFRNPTFISTLIPFHILSSYLKIQSQKNIYS